MGDYDIEIPEDTESGMYSIRVGRFSDDSLFGCSDSFEIEGDGGSSGDTPNNGDSMDDDEDEDKPADDDMDNASMSYRF